MKKILQQVLWDMRQQPVIGIVTMTGTALAIFLIMIVVMMERVNEAPFAPETNRGRTLYGKYIHTGNVDNSNPNNGSSAGMSEKTVRRLYDNLDGAECMTVICDNDDQNDVMVPGHAATMQYVKASDHNIWRVFDFDFIAGRPFDRNSYETSAREIVLTESLAGRLFGSAEQALEQTVLVKQKPFRVIGVVADVSPLAREAFAEAYVTYRAMGYENYTWGSGDDDVFGPFYGIIVAESPATFGRIRADVQSRKHLLDEELKASGRTLRDHGAPFTQTEVYTVRGSNGDVDTSGRKMRWIIYGILLIVPAINLSSMTQGRLFRRIADIGVKRAFGCTRWGIVRGILAENFLVTLAGGIIGLLLCFVFGYFFSGMVFTDIEIDRDISTPLQLLFDWKLYAMALLFCFVLNLLSSGVPAWRAARVDPVKALSRHNV